MTTLLVELESNLARSYAVQRKEWASQIIREGIPLVDLISLLHAKDNTAQRFTWLIGDLLAADPTVVSPCVSLLFALRNEMPFPGMRRCVARTLWQAGIPPEIQPEAIEQLFDWLADDNVSIGCKHYCSKALLDLVKQKRISIDRFMRILEQQRAHPNDAHSCRMTKTLQRVTKLLE